MVNRETVGLSVRRVSPGWSRVRSLKQGFRKRRFSGESVITRVDFEYLADFVLISGWWWLGCRLESLLSWAIEK